MRIGSLFTGYGGLDIAVQKFFGGEMVWYSEIDKAACTVIEAHHPKIPNLGDITEIDWSTVEPVDVLTGGYPCQPFSHAGKRKGKDDERHLWPYVRDAVSQIRPRLCVLENVRGHLSMGLADVVGDLAGLGYDCRWGVVRASDAGAPHGRARVFIVAYPNGEGSQRHGSGGSEASTGGRGHVKPCASFPSDAEKMGCERAGDTRSGRARFTDNDRSDFVRELVALNESDELLPTPTPFTNSNTETPDHWLTRRAEVVERTGTHHGLPIAVAALSIAAGKPISQRDPMASVAGWCVNSAETMTAPIGSALIVSGQLTGNSVGRSQTFSGGSLPTDQTLQSNSYGTLINWGKYETAVDRWRLVMGRDAPHPTVRGSNGKERLSPFFVEWMMGLPKGWVTGHGLTVANELKMLGNGVVWQQALLALGLLCPAGIPVRLPYFTQPAGRADDIE